MKIKLASPPLKNLFLTANISYKLADNFPKCKTGQQANVPVI